MHHFTATDGIRIAYQLFGSDRSRPPVVLHHGYIVDARLNWVGPGIVAALVAAGRWVVAPDARGHGVSEKPHAPAFYGEARMADDLRELFDRLGEDRYDLAGYSMGAVVALLVAGRDARVRRLVVGGVGGALAEPRAASVRSMAGAAVAAGMLAAEPRLIGNPGVAAFRRLADQVAADRQAMAAQARATHAGPIELARIRVPTLVLAGEHDPLALQPERLAAAIPGARLSMVRGDHMGALQDRRFASALVDFLAEA